MSIELAASAQRVQDALRNLGVTCDVVEMAATTRTAQEAAAAVGCHVAQIAKSLIFRTSRSNRPILVIASGSNRVNEKKLEVFAGEPVVKANADFVREKTGFVIGGVPPVGHIEPLPTLLDQDLMQHDIIWAAAGTPFALFKVSPVELERITPGSRRISVK